MPDFLNHPPWYALVAVGIAAMIQGTSLFLGARQRGLFQWLWGLWGLTTIPMPSLLYYFLIVRPDRRR